MAYTPIEQSPYFAGVDQSKEYSMALFNPDRPVPQRDLNVLQSIINYYSKNLGDSLFKEGNIISGLDYDTKVNANNTVTINFHQGIIYLDGKARYVAGNPVALAGVGDETINVQIDRDIITANDDSTLIDPTENVPSSGAKSIDMLKEHVELIANDSSHPQVLRFRDGKQVITKDRPGADKLMDIMAERQFETNGSFKTSGFDLRIDSTRETDSTICVVVSEGNAYVRGYHVDSLYQIPVSLDKSMDTRQVIDEPQLYLDQQNGTTWRKVLLNNRPVASITSVTGPVQRTNSPVVHSGNSSIDTLPDQNVSSILSVVTSKGTAVSGTDFQLVNGSQIQWIAGSSMTPNSGETYRATYWYVKNFVQGADYVLTQDATQVDSNGIGAWYIDFSTMTGDKPVSNQSVSVTYNFYLARRDLLVLDELGDIKVIKGQPDTIDAVEIQGQNDPLVLNIGYVTVFPQGSQAIVNSYSVTNLPFSQLQKAMARIYTLEDNVSLIAESLKAAQGVDPTNLRGTFSDSFATLQNEDIGFAGVVENGNPVTLVGHDFEAGEISLPYADTKAYPTTVASSDTPAGYQSMIWGRLVTAPYKPYVSIDQSIATGTTNVNPYMVFDNQVGQLTITPAQDNWIDTQNITVNHEEYKTMNILRYWAHNGTGWSADAQFIYDNNQNISWQGGSGVHDWWIENKQATLTQNGGTNTIDTAETFMRVQNISFVATGLRPYADNLYLTFNGVKVALTPTNGTLSGTTAGTLKADGIGTVNGSFTIPSGQPTGKVVVDLKNDASQSSEAVTSYTAQGIHRTVEDVINNTYLSVTFADPLAETMQIDQDQILAGFNLWFSTKSSSDPVTVQLRGVSEGGNPNSKVYASRLLQPNEVNISSDGSVLTQVLFDNPVMVKQGQIYALVLVSPGSGYNIFYAKQGSTIIGSNNQTLQHQASTGVMLTSSNGNTWSPQQDSDLKFQLLCAQFQPGDATIQFNTVTNIEMDKLLMAVLPLTPQNTGCSWEMRIILDTEDTSVTIDSKPWEPISSYTDIDPQAIIRAAQVQAIFTANEFMSPMFALDDFSLRSFLTARDASYFGKTVDMTEAPFNQLTLRYKQFLPSAEATVTPKVYLGDTVSGGLVWNSLADLKALGATVTTTIGTEDVNGFAPVTHQINLPTGMTKNVFKMRLDLHGPTSFLRPRVSDLHCTQIDF